MRRDRITAPGRVNKHGELVALALRSLFEFITGTIGQCLRVDLVALGGAHPAFL